jgi:hypothetical protein
MPISLLREYEHEEGIYHLLLTYKNMWESPSMLKKELTQLYYQISNNSDEYINHTAYTTRDSGSGFHSKNSSLTILASSHTQTTGKCQGSRKV